MILTPSGEVLENRKVDPVAVQSRPALDYALLAHVYNIAHGCKVHRIPALVTAYLGYHELCQTHDFREQLEGARRALQAELCAVRLSVHQVA
jgi:hypothetical protein